MGLVLENFVENNSFSGIWEILETEAELRNICKLTKYDENLIKDTGSQQRKIELLAVRALLHTLNPEITIQYEKRKPICNKGYISISHSDKYAAIIWHPDKKPTVDIEHVNERIQRIAKRAFNENELSFAKENTQTLTTIWSCKECIYKLANIQGLDFKKQIFVADFTNIKKDDLSSLPSYSRCLVNHKRTTAPNTKKILCLLKLKNKQIKYELYRRLIDNHVLVWGLF